MAFAPGVTPWVGLIVYGARVTGNNASFTYSTSAALGVRADWPLTRRVGVMASLGVAPFSKQKVEGGDAAMLLGSVLLVSGDVGLAARLKPAVPVFFFAGGGGSYASHGTTTSDASFAPHGTIAVGYDAGRRDRPGPRLMWVGRFVIPPDPGVAGYSSKSMTFDWGIEIGVRIPARRGAQAGRLTR